MASIRSGIGENMEDRYLFKAKRLDNEEWVQGYLVYDNRDKLYRIIMEIQYSTGTCITTDIAPRVDVSTICQCTGLKDKNGKLIWENDIVRDEYDCVKPAKLPIGAKRNLWSTKSLEVEVVGNRFDNPELLESEEK